MIFRDNIKIIYSKNIKQTLDIILQIKRKYENGKFIKNEDTSQEYLSSIKLNKKQNMDKKLCNILQLATIPGVSKNISTIIKNKVCITPLFSKNRKARKSGNPPGSAAMG